MLRALTVALSLLAVLPAHAQPVTRLPAGHGPAIALTFDGCEAKGQPAWLDKTIVATLEAEKVPATFFVTGLFARRNATELARLSATGLIEVENHSWDHPAHFEKLPTERQDAEISDTGREIESITGKTPRFFRFPGGHYDAAALERVEAAGLRVVHWSWESGDPAKGLAPEHLKAWVASKTRAGDILIFHVNGRATATAAALSQMLSGFRAKGFRFVRLDALLP